MKAEGRNPREQQQLGFGLADGSARDREIQLGRAIGDQRLDSDALMLLLLVFRQTAEGLGPEWLASDEMVLGHALGPKCGRTKLYTTRRALTDAGILSVKKHRAEDGLRRHYRILWIGVYTVRGLPLPEQLRGPDDFQDADFQDADFQDADFQDADFQDADFQDADFQDADFQDADAKKPSPIPAGLHAGASAPAGARLSSCLVCLSVVDVDDKDIQARVREKANAIRNAIFALHPGSKLDTETRRFIATVAAAAVAFADEYEDLIEWIDYAVDVTKRAKATTPGAHLRNTLRNSLIEFAGLCETIEEANATCGKIWSASRKLARPILSRPRESSGVEQ